YYRLYDPQAAFGLMMVSTLVGAAMAMRGKLVSIAVLSLIGGHLAPLLLAGEAPKLVGFLLYLLMLQAIALVLAWWGNSPKWWTRRGVSLAGWGLWVLGVLAGAPGGQLRGAGLVFMLVYAGLDHGEVLASSMRARGAREARPGGVFLLVVTALLAAGLLWIFRE